PTIPICTHKIGLQREKPSHAWLLIRFPREFRKLVGAKATIYENTHNGSLAFFVVAHHEHKEAQRGSNNL
ncbi:MAG: hypothetical protein ACXVIK_08510, partial [Halobacteriota archaeon]